MRNKEYVVKVTRAGWFNFEGFGRPYEAWHDYDGEGMEWQCCGRAFTRRGAARKAERHRIRFAATHMRHRLADSVLVLGVEDNQPKEKRDD